MLVITLFFSIVRPYNSLVYAPKLRHADAKHAPPEIGRGLFAWFSPVMKTTEADMVDKVGTDAAVFLRFTRMCRNMFLCLSIVGCGILIPTHLLTSNQDITKDIKLSNLDKSFQLMTPQYVQGSPMWSHVICSWVFDLVVTYFLWINYRAVTRLRRRYFESAEYQTSLHARSIWLIDIPQSNRSDEGILRIVDSVEHTTSIPRATIARNVKDLPKLIEQHDNAVRQLESVLAKYLKKPNSLPAHRPLMKPFKQDHRVQHDGKRDAIDYLAGRIKELEIEIRAIRDTVDLRDPMPYGFATFDRIEEAHVVAYAARKKHPKGATIKLAPPPNDLIWTNLPLSKGARRRKRLLNNFWVLLLTVVWVVPNALMAIFLVNLSNLSALWPAFANSFNGNPTVWAAVQAIAAPGLTSLIYLVLPIIFRRMSIRAGDMTKTKREAHVTHRLYSFFIFNNLIVFSTFSAMSQYVAAVVINRQKNQDFVEAVTNGDLPSKILATLCRVSPFWVVWLLQRNLGSAIDLAQMVTLLWHWFARTFMSPTPRQTIEWTAPQAFDYASYYNYFLFYSTVTLCYATIQPLVLLVTFLFFAIDAWLKKYLLLYVFITKTESGGELWKVLFNRVLFGTLLANLIAALVVKAAFGSWTMLGCMAPLVLYLLAFKIYCSRTFDRQCKYYSQAILTDPAPTDEAGQKAGRTERVGVKFGHPALYKPLITPMVHAKAQRVLGQISHGRVDADGPTEDSDIVMDPMSQHHPGKVAHFAAAAGPGGAEDMFEVVPESRLDFSYFKNRADFSEEHGGQGELYGRPADVVSERSHTPRSFQTDRSADTSSVRGRRVGSSASWRTGGEGRGSSHRDREGHGNGNGDLGGVTRDGFVDYRIDGGGRRELYRLENESETVLLRHAQPLGMGEVGGGDGGMDRWRAAARGGYRDLSRSGDSDHTDTGTGTVRYEAYRKRP